MAIHPRKPKLFKMALRPRKPKFLKVAMRSRKGIMINWRCPTFIKKIKGAYLRIVAKRRVRLEELRKLKRRRRQRYEELKKLEKRLLLEGKKRAAFRVKKRRVALNDKAKNYAPASMELNTIFFGTADGIYASYWVGKLISTLLHQGKKKIAARALYRAFTLIKYTLNINPLLLFLETLDRVRPTFRLRNRIVRRVVIKEYPIVDHRSRQFMIAVH